MAQLGPLAWAWPENEEYKLIGWGPRGKYLRNYTRSELTQTIDPRDYGAVGDGVTDDTAALTAAITAATAVIGTADDDGAYVETNLGGRCYLVSGELTISGSATNFIKICNGKLLADDSADWNVDADGFAQKSIVKITSSSAKGVITDVYFDCADVCNAIEKTSTSGSFWRIEGNTIDRFDRWGIKLDGAGGARVNGNFITEIGSGAANFSETTIAGTLTSGSAVVSGIASTTGLVAGQTVSGIGVPFDARILSVDGATQITLTQNATTTGAASLGVNDYHGMGLWVVSGDHKFEGNTVRWCLCPIYGGSGADYGIYINNHLYNGDSGASRRESRNIYLASGATANVFTGNYLDNGMIELRELTQVFSANRIADNAGASNQCLFLLTATSAGQTLRGSGTKRFTAEAFGLPNAIANDTIPFVKLAADSGASWDAAVTDAMFSLSHGYPSIRGRAALDIMGDTATVVRRLRNAGTGARLAFNDATTVNEAFVGGTGDDLKLGAADADKWTVTGSSGAIEPVADGTQNVGSTTYRIQNLWMDGQIKIGTGKTATATAGAATLNNAAGVITSESLTTAAAATYTLTLTNSRITANSLVFWSITQGTNTGGLPVPCNVNVSSNTAVFVIRNSHAANAFNGTLKINFMVVGPN